MAKHVLSNKVILEPVNHKYVERTSQNGSYICPRMLNEEDDMTDVAEVLSEALYSVPGVISATCIYLPKDRGGIEIPIVCDKSTTPEEAMEKALMLHIQHTESLLASSILAYKNHLGVLSSHSTTSSAPLTSKSSTKSTLH